MRRSAWIFFASIFLPSLGLAWLAVHSVRDQQVVLEHQQAIICQNITDALAKNIQAQMDQVRGDFVKTTQQLLGDSVSPQVLAQNFNGKLRDAWPMAEIGFAVNLNGQIYSPEPYDGPAARTFRDENDRFLSNRENVELYSSNSVVTAQNASGGQSANAKFGIDGTDKSTAYLYNQNSPSPQNAVAQLTLKQPTQPPVVTNTTTKTQDQSNADLQARIRAIDSLADAEKKQPQNADTKSAAAEKAADYRLTNLSSGTASAARLDEDISRAKDVTTPLPAPQGAASDFVSPAASPSTRPQGTHEAAAKAVTSAPSASFAATTSVAATPPPATTTQAPPPAAAPSSTLNMSGALSAPAAPTAELPPPAPSAGLPGREAAGSGLTESNAAPVAAISHAARSSPSGGEMTLNNNANLSYNKIQRQVIPQQAVTRDTASLSNTVPEESDFRRVIGTETSGALARFLEDKLRLLVWSHPAEDAPIVFGAQLDQAKLVDALKASLQIPELAPDSYARSSNGDICAAILDDTGHPVALSRPDFKGDWKHPFVATEIGEVLPHWEAALYLVDPQQIGRAARTLQLTFGLIVLLLVAAIVSGGSLIAADVRRQVRLAQQKTDFVSNVSHELKTPLTSIRMFADLLAEKRVPDEERQATYLRIIAAEASRLTRLINNVLDFARLERGAPPGEHHDCDLVDAVRDVAETCGPHLEAAGISFRSEIEAETLPIRGDRDALAQIILNLISNAEKYGGNDVLVRVRRQETAAGALGCVDVLDRGAGIPAKQVRTIFEPFHRLDDSLSSGIPGSGLGLTLARRMARAHGGDVTYSARAGGGSCFTLTVPLEAKASKTR